VNVEKLERVGGGEMRALKSLVSIEIEKTETASVLIT
jgi:hypothetical protein